MKPTVQANHMMEFHKPITAQTISHIFDFWLDYGDDDESGWDARNTALLTVDYLSKCQLLRNNLL